MQVRKLTHSYASITGAPGSRQKSVPKMEAVPVSNQLRHGKSEGDLSSSYALQAQYFLQSLGQFRFYLPSCLKDFTGQTFHKNTPFSLRGIMPLLDDFFILIARWLSALKIGRV